MTAQISFLLSPTFPCVPWGGLQWAILESPTCTKVTAVSDLPHFAPQDFPVGTAFGEHRELRWRKRRNGTFHLVMLGDDGATLDEKTARPVERLHNEVIRLWGEPNGDAWHEARIPREIGDYPAAFRRSLVGVEIVHYQLAAKEGPVFLYRCKQLVKVAA
jgi:hypothetical protein